MQDAAHVEHTEGLVDEPFVTKKQAAAALGIPYYKVQRAAKGKLIPTYRLVNAREYVKISDIRRVMVAAGGPS